MKTNKMKVISLFSGYGTQELALKYLGVDYEMIASSDICPKVNKVYDSLHQSTMGNLGDITKITRLPECDLLTYSFPCQDISIAGKQRGVVAGTRSGLLLDVERLLKETQPTYLFMENVKNLLSKRHIPVLKSHIEFLNGLGYGCSYKLINGGKYGCPQNRERVFMMSVKDMTNEEVDCLMECVKLDTQSKVPMRNFLETDVDSKLFINAPFSPHTPKMNSMCRMVGIRDDVKYQQSQRIYSIDHCSPTLTKCGSPQLLMDDGRIRNMTPREGFRFMGVRDEEINIILTNGLTTKMYWNIAGRSICVPVVMSIFSKFFEHGKTI
jgi:DNA (cytosine-5)-methyltransferase 1